MTLLSIAIITKDRPLSLQNCLAKLEPQCKRLKIPIQVIKDKPVPIARNQAIKQCVTPYVCFIDDDCLVSPNYLEQAFKAIHMHPNAAFIVGKSQLGNPKFPTAQAQHAHQQYWFYQKLCGSTATAWNLDTKNCILNLKIIKSLGLKFDTKIAINGYDSSDTDFGFQLAKHKLVGHYQPNLILRHNETVGLRNMIKKAFLRGQLAVLIYKKWHLKNELVDLGNQSLSYRLRNLHHLPQEFRQFNVSPIIFCLIKIYQEAYFQGFMSNFKASRVFASE